MAQQEDVKKYLQQKGLELFKRTVLSVSEISRVVGISKTTLLSAISQEKRKLGEKINRPIMKDLTKLEINRVKKAIENGTIQELLDNNAVYGLNLDFEKRVSELEFITRVSKYRTNKMREMIPEDIFNNERKITTEEYAAIYAETGYAKNTVERCISEEIKARGSKKPIKRRDEKKPDLLWQMNYLRMGKQKSATEISKITGQKLELVYYYLGKLGRPLQDSEFEDEDGRRQIRIHESKIVCLGGEKTPEEISEEIGIPVNMIYYVLGTANILISKGEKEKELELAKLKIQEIIATIKSAIKTDKSMLNLVLDTILETEETLSDDIRDRIVNLKEFVKGKEMSKKKETEKLRNGNEYEIA